LNFAETVQVRSRGNSAYAFHHLTVSQTLKTQEKAQDRQNDWDVPAKRPKHARPNDTPCALLNELRDRYLNGVLHAAHVT
jgi:hypothetical protein